MRVILLGGTSHVGKSTFSLELAEKIGWRAMSTDQLSRHPGRPWKDSGQVPSHVQEYYGRPYTDLMLHEVVEHYERNVWPIVQSVVNARISNRFDDPVVLEGSAVFPHLVSESSFDKSELRALWLEIPEQQLVERLRTSSGYDGRSQDEKKRIDCFLTRALAFNRFILNSVEKHGFEVFELCEEGSRRGLLDELVSLVNA